MQTSVNQRGGFHKTLTITQNHSNEAQCMLKQQFLKDTSKYIVQLGKFYTSSASYINTFADEVHFRIRRLQPFDGIDDAVIDMPGYYDPKDYEFKGKFFTLIEFVASLQNFFHRFGFMYQALGVTENQIGDIPNAVANKQTAPLNFYREFEEEKVGGRGERECGVGRPR